MILRKGSEKECRLHERRQLGLRGMRSILVVIVCVAVVICVLPGCRDERKIDVASRLRPESMPTMATENVSTLISDSGITQYKIVSPLWLVYDNADTPYWRFPEGLYLRKYDPLFREIASVAADSAVYFKNQRLWRLDGHVELKKAPKDLFMTQQLFWDERRQELYSDSFIHIETETHVLEGHGFISNDRLTGYRIIRPTGIFPVNRDNLSGGGTGRSGTVGGVAPSGAVPIPAEVSGESAD